MAKVLSISSQVVYGHVGNSTAAFVLQRMGHEVLSLPTVLLSNRPGYKAIAGERIAPDKLDALLHAALSNGWLSDVDVIMTGYLPTPEHASLCEHWVARIKAVNGEVQFLCDPIIGDEPGGIYIGEEAARAVRGLLVPLADMVTPNCFELCWLTGGVIPDPASAAAAARTLQVPLVLVTSAPAGTASQLANILIGGSIAAATVSPRETVEAHGTGDFFAAAFLAHKLNGLQDVTALQAATAAISLVLTASGRDSELKLIETQAEWAASPPPLAPLAEVLGIAATS